MVTNPGIKKHIFPGVAKPYYLMQLAISSGISTDRNVNKEFISVYSKKNRTFFTPADHVKVIFSLLLERISKTFNDIKACDVEYKAVNLINCRVLPKVVPYTR